MIDQSNCLQNPLFRQKRCLYPYPFADLSGIIDEGNLRSFPSNPSLTHNTTTDSLVQRYYCHGGMFEL